MYFLIYGALAALLTLVLMSAGRGTSPARRISAAIVAMVLFGGLGWFQMPTFAPNFFGNWLLLATLGVFIFAVSLSGGDSGNLKELRILPILTPLVAALLVLVFLAPATTWSLFHHQSYRSLLGDVTVSSFSKDVSPVNVNQVRRVNQSLAHLLGSKRVEELPGLGSRVDLGTMNIQIINGCFDTLDGNNQPARLCFENELVWAGPLVHGGVFKWFTNGTTPGYVLVSATNQAEVYFVTALAASTEAATAADSTTRMGTAEEATASMQPLALRYLETGAYFGDYLFRRLRLDGYIDQGLADFTFEVDDTGRPFYVVTLFDNTIGFSGADATGVVVVDVQTGESNEYALEDVPAWIDRVQPESMVVTQLKDWGLYVNGYWNTWFGKLDVVTTTGDNMSLVYGADGRSYWYIGLKSDGSDMGTNSFALVDTRTKEVRRYMVAGANEASARTSAENAPGVREAGYQGTYPILYNVSGVPTYFLTLMGGDGLVKMYAFVSVENYESVGVGESVQVALRDYQNTLIRQGQQTSFNDLASQERLETSVDAVVQIDDTFYLRLWGESGVEFYGTTDVSPELKWAESGTMVVVVYERAEGQSSVQISAFDIPALGISQLPE